MAFSLNCKILGNTSYEFVVDIDKENTINDKEFNVKKLTVAHLKKLVLKEAKNELSDVDPNKLEIWKVDYKKVNDEGNILFTENDIRNKLEGEKMVARHLLKRYFNIDKEMDEEEKEGVHIFVVLTSIGKCLPMSCLSILEIRNLQ
jgi:hypothetical protein